MLGRSRAGSGKLVLAALCAAFALAALPAEAQAFDLTISTDPTTNVTEAPPTPILGAPTTFTATADPAVLNVDQLDAALVNGNTVVRTGTTPGSITVATDIAASSAPGALELDPTGSIFINTTNISTGGSQTYDDAVTLGATTTLSSTSSGSINLSSTVNGAQALTVNTAGRTTVGDAVGGTTPLASLMITNPNGTTTLDGSGVTTTAGQTYQSPVTLGGNTVLSDGNGSAQSIDLSNHALTIAGGGTLTGGVTGAGGSLTKTGSGTLALQVANSYTGGTVIDAGTISFVSGGLGPGPVTVDGGGLEWAASNTVDVSSRLNPIGAGGATFNTNGHDVTLAQPLTGPGSVIKDGTGTLTLPAANTYSGATTVAQGIIHLTGSVTSHVTLNPPGTLNCDDGTLSGGLTNDGGTASSVPGAPSGVTPGPANGHANVAFTPGAAHCFPIGYTATSSPGAVHGSGIGSPITVSPLIDGTAYTFTVTATNPIGSAASAPSAAIVPKGPLPIARIISPANGRHFKLGQFVATSFSCADAGDGPGIAACTDSGSGVLNTSHAGAFTYSVVAVSKDGQATVTQIRYVVLFPSDQLGRPQVRSNRDASVSFALKLPGPGTVEVLESALRSNLAVAAALKPGRGQFVFARAYERAKRAETIKLRVKPSSAGRKLLRHHRHPVLVRLLISFTPTHGKPRTVVLNDIRLTR